MATLTTDSSSMNPLSPSDLHHLKAAEAWLELGNHIEANEELENIAAAMRSAASNRSELTAPYRPGCVWGR